MYKGLINDGAITATIKRVKPGDEPSEFNTKIWILPLAECLKEVEKSIGYLGHHKSLMMIGSHNYNGFVAIEVHCLLGT